MTTFADDFVRIRLAQGMPVDIPLVKLGLDWPPPPRLAVAMVEVDGRPAIRTFDADRGKIGSDDLIYHRVSCSEISDEDRADMTRICRGANYAHAIVPAGST